MFKLRPYQEEAVQSVVKYFRKNDGPSLIVLPTGSGKSLVISELAKIAKRRVLVLAHVKELVEQNSEKYLSYGLECGIFSAGLNRKDFKEKVIFGSIQSVARAENEFFKGFSLIIVDECHRISSKDEGQYHDVFRKLRKYNKVKILGLTATPYRLGSGFIYKYHYHGMIRNEGECFFQDCIYELPLSYMIKNNYLTRPVKIDSPVACYDFSALELSKNGHFCIEDIKQKLEEEKRVTPSIVRNIISTSKDRLGVMIFTSTISHAHEVYDLLPRGESEIVTGQTSLLDRDKIIFDFKNQKIKYLVNVSVLTTGFDAPHVDLIAILRPTESISLYQQIVGRGLRLFEGKTDCIILDYTGQDHDIYHPEISEQKPNSNCQIVQMVCPICGHGNIFWGLVDEFGEIIEHYGRRCQGFESDEISGEKLRCSFRYRFKNCERCGEENDIAAKKCHHCQEILVDPDKKLKEAMSLKDAHVLRTDSMHFLEDVDKNGKKRLSVRYYDFDGEYLEERFYLDSKKQKNFFYHNFTRKHLRTPGAEIKIYSLEDILRNKKRFRKPDFVIGRKVKKFWKIREKVFIL